MPMRDAQDECAGEFDFLCKSEREKKDIRPEEPAGNYVTTIVVGIDGGVFEVRNPRGGCQRSSYGSKGANLGVRLGSSKQMELGDVLTARWSMGFRSRQKGRLAPAGTSANALVLFDHQVAFCNAGNLGSSTF